MEILKRAAYSAHHHLAHVPRVERVARALAGQIGSARSLLDIGCGDGTVARTIAAQIGAGRVAGVDVKVRPYVAIEVKPYDGLHLPFADGEFEAVVVSDVLHHAHDPRAVLREALRVASRIVGIKDHFRFGWLSEKILLAMDLVGNAGPGVDVRGTYFNPREWAEMVEAAGGRFSGLDWPLRIHDFPFRWVTRDRVQFAAGVVHARPEGRA